MCHFKLESLTSGSFAMLFLLVIFVYQHLIEFHLLYLGYRVGDGHVHCVQISHVNTLYHSFDMLYFPLRRLVA